MVREKEREVRFVVMMCAVGGGCGGAIWEAEFRWQ